MSEIDKKHLAGLKFKGSTRKKAKEQGARDQHVPFERALGPADVLSSRETDTHVHIVAADGQKHAVEKKQK